MGTMRHGDLLVREGVLVGVGPGIINAAHDPRRGSPSGSTVVTASGTAIIPLVLDLAATGGLVDDARAPAGSLVPSTPANFIVVTDDDRGLSTQAMLTSVVREPERVIAVFRDGEPISWRGETVTPPASTRQGSVVDRTGTWVDSSGFLEQTLTQEGRYHETRGGRPLAFQGRYWIDGDRIDYHDDLGLWAFGEFEGDVLHHAGYRMRRRGQ